MRELWPSPTDEIDPVTAYAADHRPAPPGRPWVISNMIAAVDGAATDAAGTSGGFGSPGDRAVFLAVRSVADVIVAGSGTVIAEDYGPARLTPALAALRAERGQQDVPRIAVVTASLRIEPDRRLFREAPAGARPLVLTTARADPERRRALAAVADILEVGDDRVDWGQALAALRSVTGAGVVLCEGGPQTNAQLVAEDLVDEQCLTVAPYLVGDAAPRIAQGPTSGALARLALARVLADDDYLFLQYMRRRG